MISTSTIKKLNAVSTSISLMEDSGVSVAEFFINDLTDEEVYEISTDRNVEYLQPTFSAPYFRCIIQKDVYKLHINGVRKKRNITFNP